MEPENVGAVVARQPAGQSCACCTEADVAESATALPRELMRSAATELGIVDEDQEVLLGTLDAGDCRGTRDLMAAQVEVRLATAGHHVVENIGATATTHAGAPAGARGMPSEVVDLHHQTVTALDRLARLQAAAAHLKAEPNASACSADCPCAEAAAASASSPAAPQSGVGLVLGCSRAFGGPAIACTLDGGIEAMRIRVGDWQHVVGRATSRGPIAGGVTLTYDHDVRLTVELARLAAAEYACCSFFTFTLTIGPTGMAFTVTAPDEAGDVVTAMFGAYGSALAETQ